MLSWRAEVPHVYRTYKADYHYKKAKQNADCTMSISETATRQRSKERKCIHSNFGIVHPNVFPQVNQKYVSLQHKSVS
jgi:hypothetical protein